MSQALQGFDNYINAVSLQNVSRTRKLDAIVDCFADECVLVPSQGSPLTGKKEVRGFFEAVLSSSNDTFSPTLCGAVCVSADGLTVAAQVYLKQINKKVGDFWSFDGNGKIVNLSIYSQNN